MIAQRWQKLVSSPFGPYKKIDIQNFEKLENKGHLALISKLGIERYAERTIGRGLSGKIWVRLQN